MWHLLHMIKALRRQHCASTKGVLHCRFGSHTSLHFRYSGYTVALSLTGTPISSPTCQLTECRTQVGNPLSRRRKCRRWLYFLRKRRPLSTKALDKPVQASMTLPHPTLTLSHAPTAPQKPLTMRPRNNQPIDGANPERQATQRCVPKQGPLGFSFGCP